MKFKYHSAMIIAILLLFCSRYFAQTSYVIYVQNGNTEVGLLPDVGGRIVVLRQRGHENLLKAPTELWEEPQTNRPTPDAKHPSMKSYFGQIVWVGPQSDWWIQQDVNPTLRDQSAQWPPDPYLIYGEFHITAQTDSSIVMQGPDSPVSGLQLTKEILIDHKGKVHFKVSGQNIRKENIQWDLWCNLRTSGLNRCYVPVETKSDVRIVNPYGDGNSIPYNIIDGYFTFTPENSSTDRKTAKAFIYPKTGFIACFQKNKLLRIHFNRLDRSQIHYNQGHVEIYQDIGMSSINLLELEHHAAYQVLKPGDTLSNEEIWEVIPYEGEDTQETHIKFLKTL
ncbi:DUF4380 domain-containing protein [bacterium]